MPPATGVLARRVTASAPARQAPAPRPARQPPLRVVGAAPRRARQRLLRFSALLLLTGSLLGVVFGHAMLAQEQIKLSGAQARLSAEQALHRQLLLAVAQAETPSRDRGGGGAPAHGAAGPHRAAPVGPAHHAHDDGATRHPHLRNLHRRRPQRGRGDEVSPTGTLSPTRPPGGRGQPATRHRRPPVRPPRRAAPGRRGASPRVRRALAWPPASGSSGWSS